MVKKIFLRLSLGLLLLLLAKGLFFSGITQQKANLAAYQAAPEKGFVWAKAGAQYARGAVGEFFLGQHYRPVWTTPIKAPILDISRMYGGLTMGKLGGGMQTTSLGLTDKQGRPYTLRSLDKDPIEILPPFWQRTFVADLMRDQISGANPYSALVVAKLADAVGIPHTNPQIMFVSAGDKSLGQHRNLLGNKLFLFEEKYSGRSLAHFPGATNILNSVEMLDNRFRYGGHQIDQKAYAKCRLFDILIGDWDRHEGQWNWAAYPVAGGILYKSIPKDRDQAFSRYQDGVIPWLLTRDFVLPKFGNFSDQININSYTVNASFLDERALNGVTAADFKQLALELQQALTDAQIEAAVRRFPEPVYRLVGVETVQKLKNRRQQLVQAAAGFYSQLAKKVIIAGSDEREKFEVQRVNDAVTLVKIFQLSPVDSVGRLLYRRQFNTTETKEITLHGLAGDDVFIINGKVKSGIRIHIYGGLGEDEIQDSSVVASRKKKTVIYDTRKGNQIIWTPEMKNRTTDDISVHNYDREGY